MIFEMFAGIGAQAKGVKYLKFANTITTKQDRNPNAGIIPFN